MKAVYMEVDGHVPSADELATPALSGYGHFTAMQVRDLRTRGIEFHTARLDAATRELFGVGLDGERVRGLIRHALGASRPDASVRVNVFSPEENGDVSVLVSVRPPQPMLPGPWKLSAVRYQRPFAHVKHVGGFAQGRYNRLVAKSGFDEALLVGDDGLVAEGAITNIGFIDGDTVLWPEAPMLLGIGMQVLERELGRAGVETARRRITLDDLDSLDGVFVTNSRGIAAVGRIDAWAAAADTPLLEKVLGLHATAPWEAI